MLLARVFMRVVIVSKTGVTAIPSANAATSITVRTIAVEVWRRCRECHRSSSLSFTLILVRIIGWVSTQRQGPSSQGG